MGHRSLAGGAVRTVIALADTVAQWATAVGAAFVAFQLWQTQRALRSTYERTFVERYERIIANVPLLAVLEGRLPENMSGEQADAIERAFFDYFELCEEELYFRKLGRISRRTWAEWWDGIALHFCNEAFAASLENLKNRSAPLRGAGQGRPTRFHYVLQASTAAQASEAFDPVEGWWRRSIRQR